MLSSDDDPRPSDKPSTEAFFLPGGGVSVLLIHGFTGTPYGMRYLGERLHASGARVLGVRLAGHGATPIELGASTHEHWYESVIRGLEQLRDYGDPIVAAGLSMGALLATRLALDQREAIAGLVMLAPAFFVPLGHRAILGILESFGSYTENVYLHRPGGADIHDASARGLHSHHKLMPLKAALSLNQLARMVRPRLGEIVQPTLLIHARNDHTCPCDKNVGFVMSHLGSAEKRAVILEESYHVITVDTEKDRVAAEVTAFVAQFRRPAPALLATTP